MELSTIGLIHSPHKNVVGAPLQPRAAKGVEGRVEVFGEHEAGLADVDGFDRIWLLYWFHRAAQVQLTVRPLLDGADRGVFATRAPCRPNPIGLSCVRLKERKKLSLIVSDIDILDGTPLLDIKPYAPQFDHYDVGRIGWLQGKTFQGRRTDERFKKYAE